MHPQPHGHPVRRRQGEAGVERLDGRHNAEPGPDGPLGVVFMGYGIAKIHQQASAQVLRHIAVEALDYRRAGLMIGAHDVPKVFGVQVAREPGRIHQVTEQHREGAAFGLRWHQSSREWLNARTRGRCWPVRR
jgi:hypothetical protein